MTRPRPTRPAALAFGLAALALAGCSYPDFGPDFTTEARGMDPASFACCFEPEKFYPAPVARLALALGNALGPQASQLAYSDYEASAYPGKLTGKPEAVAAILAPLRPLDLLIIGNTSFQIGRLMPGRFSHALVYVGTEAELRAAGLWTLPEVVPWHDEIRAGRTMIEAASPDVHLVTPAKALETDRVLSMRPALSAAERRLAARRLFGAIGTPFNYALSVDPDNARFVCTGLIDHAMPGIAVTRREIYGATTILPDDLAAQAIRGERLAVVGYVLGNDGPGFAHRSTTALMVDIAAYWGVPGKAE